MKKYGYVETDGMFTEEGNKQAARVIHLAKRWDYPWEWTLNEIRWHILPKKKKCVSEGVTKKMVCKLVFDAVGYSEDTPLYI